MLVTGYWANARYENNTGSGSVSEAEVVFSERNAAGNLWLAGGSNGSMNGLGRSGIATKLPFNGVPGVSGHDLRQDSKRD